MKDGLANSVGPLAKSVDDLAIITETLFKPTKRGDDPL